MGEEEKAAYDAADAEYRIRHPDCRAVRWSMEGSCTTHCGYCYPPLPLSETQRIAIGRLFSAVTPKTELDTWLNTLTCGHETTTSVNVCHRETHQAHGVVRCPVCDLARGVVTVAWLGPALSPDEAGRIAEQAKANDGLRAAQAEVSKRSKELAQAERRLKRLSAKSSQRRNGN